MMTNQKTHTIYTYCNHQSRPFSAASRSNTNPAVKGATAILLLNLTEKG